MKLNKCAKLLTVISQKCLMLYDQPIVSPNIQVDLSGQTFQRMPFIFWFCKFKGLTAKAKV